MMNRLLLLFFTYNLAGGAPFTDKNLVTINVNESNVYAGKNSMISISVEVMKGYHIQANKVYDESLIPTTVEINKVKGISFIKIKFPPGKKFKLEGTGTFLNVYDGKFIIKLFIIPSAELQTGNYILGARLHYQACDSASCLFPRSVDFSIPIHLAKVSVFITRKYLLNMGNFTKTFA